MSREKLYWSTGKMMMLNTVLNDAPQSQRPYCYYVSQLKRHLPDNVKHELLTAHETGLGNRIGEIIPKALQQ